MVEEEGRRRGRGRTSQASNSAAKSLHSALTSHDQLRVVVELLGEGGSKGGVVDMLVRQHGHKAGGVRRVSAELRFVRICWLRCCL